MIVAFPGHAHVHIYHIDKTSYLRGFLGGFFYVKMVVNRIQYVSSCYGN